MRQSRSRSAWLKSILGGSLSVCPLAFEACFACSHFAGAGFLAIEDPEERARYAGRWLFGQFFCFTRPSDDLIHAVCLGIGEIAANQEEIFGRPPNGKYVSPDASSLDLILVTVTPYNSDSGALQRWAADVDTSRQHFDTVDRRCEQ